MINYIKIKDELRKRKNFLTNFLNLNKNQRKTFYEIVFTKKEMEINNDLFDNLNTFDALNFFYHKSFKKWSKYFWFNNFNIRDYFSIFEMDSYWNSKEYKKLEKEYSKYLINFSKRKFSLTDCPKSFKDFLNEGE